jgi:hypothetical protein
MNEMGANRRALRGLARMLQRYLQKKLSAKKKRQLKNRRRGDAQMPASIQLIT